MIPVQRVKVTSWQAIKGLFFIYCLLLIPPFICFGVYRWYSSRATLRQSLQVLSSLGEPFAARLHSVLTSGRLDTNAGFPFTRGKCVVVTGDEWEGVEEEHPLYSWLPPRLRATTPEDVGCVIVVQESVANCQTWVDGSGNKAIRCDPYYDLTVIDWRAGRVVGEATFEGSRNPPPSEDTWPNDAAADFVRKLPHLSLDGRQMNSTLGLSSDQWLEHRGVPLTAAGFVIFVVAFPVIFPRRFKF